MENGTPLLSICCITYNHEPYIRDCIEGFLLQKTTFSIEILIHDDASTDRTPSIIAEYQSRYPELIKPMYQTDNQYSKGVRVTWFNLERAQGRYIAFCEGDDYWTDPLKLQKQVDYLDKHPDCGLVCTDVKRYIQHTGKFEPSGIPHYDVARYADLINWRNQISTLTICYRKSLIYKDPQLDPEQYFMGDVFRFLSISLTHYIKFLPEVTGVYRVLKSSASHFCCRLARAGFTYKVSKTFLWYLEHYPLEDKAMQRRLVNQHRMAIFLYAKTTGDYSLSRSFRFDFPRTLQSGYTLIYVQHLLCKNKYIFQWISRWTQRKSKIDEI